MMDEELLRKDFERLARDSYGFKRSRKGNYVNPVVARDWKWFCLGVIAGQPDLSKLEQRIEVDLQPSFDGPTTGRILPPMRHIHGVNLGVLERAARRNKDQL